MKEVKLIIGGNTPPILVIDANSAAERMRAKLKELWPSAYKNVSESTLLKLAEAALDFEAVQTVTKTVKGTIHES